MNLSSFWNRGIKAKILLKSGHTIEARFKELKWELGSDGGFTKLTWNHAGFSKRVISAIDVTQIVAIVAEK